MKKATKRGNSAGKLFVVVICLSALLLMLGCDQNANQAGCDELAVDTDQLPPATKAWWTYQREATYGVKKSKVKVPMRDGEELGCTLARPANDSGMAAQGKFPGLVVEFTPYTLLQSFFNSEAAFFTRRGYNTLVCTMRGTGQSDGEWDHAMTSQEQRDAYDLVEWLGTQNFSDGRVGQFGESYGGYTSFGAATLNPPHLKAVAPLQSPGSLYDDVIYPGGIKSTEGGTIDNWPGMAQMMTNGAVDPETEYAAARPHPAFDDFWKDGAMVAHAKEIQVPVLAVGGWNDIFFRSGTLSMIEAAPLDKTWAIYVPFTHIYPVSLTEGEPALAQLPSGVLLAWFDRWVKELPNVPVPQQPTFVSYEGPFGVNIEVGNGYEELTGWASAGANVLNADVLSYQLGANGALAPNATGGEVQFSEPKEPTDAGGSVTFSTKLDRDRVWLGHATLKFQATLSGATDANFYVELIDVAKNGKQTVVNDGFLKASHRLSHENPQPITEGALVDYEISIRADHYRFRAGHSVKLRISGGPSKTLVPVTDAVTVTIKTGPVSTLSLSGFDK